MVEMRLFGSPDMQSVKSIREAGFHSGNLYIAVLDISALWDPEILDRIMLEFPQHLLPENDLYLALIECVANAAMHGNADALGFYARVREGMLLLSFYQTPPMDEIVTAVLEMARRGGLPDYTFDLPGGLGFPILLRLAHRVTISADRAKLQLWFRKKTGNKLRAMLRETKKS